MKKALYYLMVLVLAIAVAAVAGDVLGSNPGYTGVFGAIGVVIGAFVFFVALGKAIDELRSLRASGRGLDGIRRFRAWHPGQLATAWIGVLLADLVFRALFNYNQDRGYDINDFGAAMCVVIGGSITVAMLWISWQWFGSRQQKG
jgi:hypothetical protein